jgi:hypothetical protein
MYYFQKMIDLMFAISDGMIIVMGAVNKHRAKRFYSGKR